SNSWLREVTATGPRPRRVLGMITSRSRSRTANGETHVAALGQPKLRYSAPRLMSRRPRSITTNNGIEKPGRGALRGKGTVARLRQLRRAASSTRPLPRATSVTSSRAVSRQPHLFAFMCGTHIRTGSDQFITRRPESLTCRIQSSSQNCGALVWEVAITSSSICGGQEAHVAPFTFVSFGRLPHVARHLENVRRHEHRKRIP